MEEEGGWPVHELEVLREEISRRLERERAVLGSIRRTRKWRGVGWWLSFLLFSVSLVLIILLPNGFMLWVFCSYLLVSLAWLILFLPTSKKEAGFLRQERYRGKKDLKGAAKAIAKGRKTLITEVWLDAFLYGNTLSLFSVTLLFSVNIVGAFYFGLMERALPLQLSLIIIVQGAAIILLRFLLLIYRPYAHGTFRMPENWKGRLTVSPQRGRVVLVIAYLAAVFLVVVSGIVVVLGFLLPGATRSSVWNFLASNNYSNSLALVLFFLMMYFIWRFLLSVMSIYLGEGVAASRVRRLEEDVLAPLDEVRQRHDAGKIDQAKLKSILSDYRRIVIFEFVKHDLFGLAPVYLIAPDMRFLMSKQVLDAVTRAEGVGGAPGRVI
ncbi:MAG: hypothetical protein QW520_03380 [Methanomassiliicoccales archaeon]